MTAQTKKLTGISLLKQIVETWDPTDLTPVTVRFKDIWPVIDEYDALQAEVDRLRAELSAIANSEAAACSQFDWNGRGCNLRNSAFAALHGDQK